MNETQLPPGAHGGMALLKACAERVRLFENRATAAEAKLEAAHATLGALRKELADAARLVALLRERARAAEDTVDLLSIERAWTVGEDRTLEAEFGGGSSEGNDEDDAAAV